MIENSKDPEKVAESEKIMEKFEQMKNDLFKGYKKNSSALLFFNFYY